MSNLTNEDFLNLVNNKPKSSEKYVFKTSARRKDLNEMKEHLSTARKDDAWYKNAGEKLEIMIKAISPLHSHSHEKVRFEIARLCLDIFTYCPR